MLKVLFGLVALVVLGGAAVLATWDMPPPTATTEKVISSERFQ